MTQIEPSADADDLRALVAKVAAAYFSNRHIPAAEITEVIGAISGALLAVGQPDAAEAETAARLSPAEIRRSITPTALISFEDGRAYKTLGRHLRARGLTPDDYRRKWGLPADYPMVAASYSETRSGLAKRMNLAQHGVRARKRRAAQAEQLAAE